MATDDPREPYPGGHGDAHPGGGTDAYADGYADADRTRAAWSSNYPPAEPVSAGGPPGYPSPRRGRIVALIALLGALGLLLGVGVGALVNHGSGRNGVIAGGPTPSPAGPATTTAAPTASATTRPAASTSAASAVADYSPLPDDPSSVNADFGFITAVSQTGGRVTVSFDRAQFLTGEAATAANGGVPPDDDYLIRNTNPTLRSFVVAPKASILGTARLNTLENKTQRQALTPAQFVHNAKGALQGDGRIPVWLRHTHGLSGDITALAEQYLP